MKNFEKIDRGFETVQTMISMIFFIIMLFLGAVQVIGRYAFSASPPWCEELIRFSCIWMVFIGSGLTIRDDAHVSVDILLGFMKNNKARCWLYVISRLTAVVFLILFFPASIDLIVRSGSSRAAALPLPYTYVYLAIPVGIVSMLLSYVSAIPKYSIKYKKGEL
ncbi:MULTISPECIES: TRAP transporter small permease [Anaerotruncus]|uniref:TRAP transporter small permease n=1 Tax=Anaerotruncus TaxID=244127 RepID=UPI0008350538|nr:MULTISPECIES: TRAP transporter small permease [Anaerotruncus]RGX54692.1 TRAP transporter small permease [Anaerotruncus sp. AF02-27]